MPPPTPSPTPTGQCYAYSGNEAVPEGQLPYVGMTACQSSSYGSVSYAVRALTNSVSTRWSGTCTATNGGEGNAWWVNLAETSIVNSVQLTNRADCCGWRLHYVDIFVSGQYCANTGEIKQGETVKFDCVGPLSGDQIMLRPKSDRTNTAGKNNPYEILTICGFSAYGK